MARGKNKNKNKTTPDAVAKYKLNEKKEKVNPFDIHINKVKLDVIGRNLKGERGRPGVARDKAISIRKQTLLQEYLNKDKNNLFIDRRIGEKDASMTQEDKAMARFAAAHVKAYNQKTMFNLNDEEEVLTHRGQTLAEIEKFEDPRSDDDYSDDENRDGRLDKKFVSEAHFGGGILSKSNGVHTGKNLIEELIKESKKRKAEKQKIRQETIDLTEKLDADWKDLIPMMAGYKRTGMEVEERKKPDDYDRAVRELKFEIRGTPTDKLESEEEKIKKEKEKLEALEADRLARMKGVIEDANGKIKHRSADDLDDDYIVEAIEDEPLAYDADGCVIGLDKKKKANGIENEDEKEDEKDDDEDNDEDDDEGEEDDDEDEDDLSDLRLSESESEDEEEPETTENSSKVETKSTEPVAESKLNGVDGKPVDEVRINEIREDLQRRKEIMEKARKELPHTYTAPETYEELRTLIKDQSPDYQSIILERIYKCNHWSLGDSNREKLCKVFGYLLQYIIEIASVTSEKDVCKCFQIFDRLCPHLWDLAQASAQNTATCVQSILISKHEEFEENQKKYPGLEVLILFKLVSLLFPTSDFRHPVVSPCIIFMDQILIRCRIKTRRDISKGLFLCALVYEYVLMAKRFSPSVINYLRGVIYLATPKPPPGVYKTIPPFKSNGDASNLLILQDNQEGLIIDETAANMKDIDLCQSGFDDEFKVRAFVTAVNMIAEFKKLYEEIDAAYLIFEPIVKLLKMQKLENYPKNIKKHTKKIRKDLQSLRNKKLEYMVAEQKKPKALRLYEPRIEKVYDGKTHKPMSKKKAEKAKMLHKIKRETKSAIREVRRDTSFLAKVQIKQQIRRDTERKRKVKEIFGDAAAQQGELNQMKRSKK